MQQYKEIFGSLKNQIGFLINKVNETDRKLEILNTSKVKLCYRK